MAYITAETNLIGQGAVSYISVPVYAAAVIKKGGIVVMVSGYAKPGYGNSGSGGFAIGVAMESVTGGTASGDVMLKVEPFRSDDPYFWFDVQGSNAGDAWIGEHAFVYDDTAVLLASSTTYDVPIGTVVAYAGGATGAGTRVLVDTSQRSTFAVA